jgi:Cys-rich protein (TIGR01571 family)
MHSSLWMPLNGPNKLVIRVDPRPWTSGIYAMSTCPRVQDCCFSFCCNLCAFSEEYAYLGILKSNRKNSGDPTPMPQGCDKYCNPSACLIYILCGVLMPIPCCLNCILRQNYRESFRIEGGCCRDLLATFICCCCAHAQVDHMPPPLLCPPRARSSRRSH